MIIHNWELNDWIKYFLKIKIIENLTITALCPWINDVILAIIQILRHCYSSPPKLTGSSALWCAAFFMLHSIQLRLFFLLNFFSSCSLSIDFEYNAHMYAIKTYVTYEKSPLLSFKKYWQKEKKKNYSFDSILIFGLIKNISSN